jgi:catalase (peroxidase I)
MSSDAPTINKDSLKSDIQQAIINRKVNICPMTVRLAWHAAGTYDAKDGSGGSNGAGMRYAPESTDGANSGLHIVRSILEPIKQQYPHLSYADLWTYAGAASIEFMGGPKIPHTFGRTDFTDNKRCPANGRLPDASQGAQHLRDVFYRMGFNDKEIVALSGAHTLGRCHIERSGYDGPWTRNPLKFDNQYFKNLLHMEWRPKKWTGPLQYEDAETGELMMLPTDLALRDDPKFRVYVEQYAKDEQLFFNDFAQAFGKLLANGVPQPPPAKELTQRQKDGIAFREAAQHGSVDVAMSLAPKVDINELEPYSGRTALHKAAFFGHVRLVQFLLSSKARVNVQDWYGDTPLHDAVKNDNPAIVELLLKAGADTKIKNKEGKTPLEVAKSQGHRHLTSKL